MKTHNFVYLTTNIINGKQYVGDHSTNNLNDKYLGSGKATLLPAIKKHGKENFKREILEQFPSKEQAFLAQEKYIKQYNTLSPNGYNISPKGGHGISGCFAEETKKKISDTLKNHVVSEESKEKNRLSHKGKTHTEESKKNMSDAHKGIVVSEETKKKIGEANKLSLKGKKHSEERKKKMSESHKGKIVSEETKLKISMKEKGKIVSQETKKKMSDSHKGQE